MTMDLEFIEGLIAIVSRSPIGELELKRDGLSVRIVKPVSPQPVRPSELSSEPSNVQSTTTSAGARARHSIVAALTGVFYRAGAEGEPPFVSVGEAVEEGQKIGVLEAMKTFNVVEADRGGRIVEVRFDDRSSVQAGDVLFVLEDAG